MTVQNNLTMLSRVCCDEIGGVSENTDEEISVKEDNSGYNINFLDDLFDDDEDQMNREQEEDQESGDASNKHDTQDNISINQDSAHGVEITGLSLQGTREDDQDQDRQETTQHDSPKELTKSQRKRLRKKEKRAEKRKREQSEDQESEVDKEDDASIKGDSADGVEERRKKKKKRRSSQ